MNGLEQSFMEQMRQSHGMINPAFLQSLGGGGAGTGGPQANGFDITGVGSFGANFPGPLGQAGQMGQMGQAGVLGPRAPGMFEGLSSAEGLSGIMRGIGSLGQAYAAVKGVGLAEKQARFQKKAWKKNIANQTKSYNTRIHDRAGARDSYLQGGGQKAAEYIKKHSL